MRQLRLWQAAVALLAIGAAAASCATGGTWGTTNPPVVVVNVTNFSSTTDIGIGTEISFSVRNVTDRDLTDLTLTVTTNPSNGVVVPFREMTIDRIEAGRTWTPRQPFLVRGKHAGQTAVFFTVSRNGEFLAKDYAIISVAPDEEMRPLFMKP
jgi:photosystem II stability/assembly factor-like uncharacterized protein